MNIIRLLKDKLTYKKNSSKLIQSLKVGDLVWSKRYQNKKQKKAIDTGHQEGPYIIIYKDDNAIYGLYCSSTEPKDQNKMNHFKLELDEYKLKLRKTTFVQTNEARELNSKQIVRKMGKLNKSDLNTIKKMIVVLNDFSPSSINIPFDISTLKFTLSPSDIIRVKKSLYLIFKEDDTHFYAYQIMPTKQRGNLTYNNQKFTISYTNMITIPKEDEKFYEIAYFISPSLLPRIIASGEESKKKNEKAKIIKRGDVVRLEGEPHLIYGELGNSWQTYKLFPNKKYLPGSIEISVSGFKYRTYFEDILIPKDKVFQSIKTATDEDLERIRYERKSVKKYEGNNAKINNIPQFKLSQDQQDILYMLRKLKFTEDQIIALMLRIGKRPHLNSMLDYFYLNQKNKTNLSQEDILNKIQDLLRKG